MFFHCPKIPWDLITYFPIDDIGIVSILNKSPTEFFACGAFPPGGCSLKKSILIYFLKFLIHIRWDKSRFILFHMENNIIIKNNNTRLKFVFQVLIGMFIVGHS